MNLFVMYIGGSMKNSLIELHDIRFVVADTLEETYDELRRSWWGIPKSLHIDCWGILKSTATHRISLEKKPCTSAEKLYFVNLGGYDPTHFSEQHTNVFVVADNKVEAKVKAVKQVAHWHLPHHDYLHEVENIFCLDKTAKNKNLYIHLHATNQPLPFEFTTQYIHVGEGNFQNA